jgi:hypothetical protein
MLRAPRILVGLSVLLCLFSLCKKPPVVLHPPSTPYEPVGASEGVTDTAYYFHTSSTDPDSDPICYRLLVSGGDTTNWLHWRNSGDTFWFSVTFPTADTYSVAVQARDSYDSLSGWSKPHLVAISGYLLRPNLPPAPGRAFGPLVAADSE